MTQEERIAYNKKLEQEYYFYNVIGQAPYVAPNSVDQLNRHKGVLSDGNPYVPQLAVATDKQDIDALYAGAMDYEAKKAVLDEQREYDLPEKKVARDRAAGINTDLPGSSGSAGSAGGSSAQMQGLTNETKYSNFYDNANLVIGGIGAAANLMSSFAGSFGTIVNAASTIATLPSQINLNKSTANLQDAQANEITTLLDNKDTNLKNANILQGVQTTSGLLQQLAGISDLIAPDAGRDNIISSLKGLGMSEDESVLGTYADIIGQFHASPEKRKQYAKSKLSAQYAEEELKQTTPKFIADITANGLQVQALQSDTAVDFENLQNMVMSGLSNKRTANDITDSITNGLALSADESEFDIQQFNRDKEVYFRNLELIESAITRNNKKIALIKKMAENEGRNLYASENLWIQSLEAANGEYATIGSQHLFQANRLIRQCYKIDYLNIGRIGPSGMVVPSPLTGDFAEYNMEDILNGTTSVESIKNDFGDRVISFFTNKINPIK